MWDQDQVSWPAPGKRSAPPDVPADPVEDPDDHALLFSMKMAYDANDEDEYSYGDEDGDGDESDVMPSLPPQTLPLAAFLSFDDAQLQSQSPLFQLPYEIRLAIWELVTATQCDRSRPYDRRLHLWRPDNTGPRHVDTALLLTCRAVYSEAWDLPLSQTPLVIFDGSESDRPCWISLYPPRRDATLLFPQPWQILLMQNLDMTFRQQSLDGGGIGRWIREFGNARSIAGGLVSYFAQENKGKLRQDIVRRILSRPIRTAVVKLNRRDWWTWASEPPREDKQGSTKAASQDETLHLSVTIPQAWSVIPGLFARDFEFTLALETFGAKKSQLEKVVKQAQTWMFQAPLGTNPSGKKKLVWDGDTIVESWDQERPEVFGWMKDAPWKETAHRVEVRRVKYVLQDVDMSGDI